MDIIDEIRQFQSEIEFLWNEYQPIKNKLLNLQKRRMEKEQATYEKYFKDVLDGKKSQSSFNQIVKANCMKEDIEIKTLKNIISINNRRRHDLEERINLWKKQNFTA